MKKLLTALLALTLLCACALAETVPEESAFVPTDSRTLVACFSATGNTWPLAEAAAAYLNADLFRIEPAEPYTDADLNYSDSNCRANREMEDEACRPALAAAVENMEQYDTVLLGFPIWWGQAPRIVETFVENHDFAGKTVLCFCTSGSSGYGSSGEILSALADESAVWLEERRFAAGTSAEEMEKWLQEMEHRALCGGRMRRKQPWQSSRPRAATR